MKIFKIFEHIFKVLNKNLEKPIKSVMINSVHLLTLKGSVFLATELLQPLQMNTYFLST